MFWPHMPECSSAVLSLPRCHKKQELCVCFLCFDMFSYV